MLKMAENRRRGPKCDQKVKYIPPDFHPFLLYMILISHHRRMRAHSIDTAGLCDHLLLLHLLRHHLLCHQLLLLVHWHYKNRSNSMFQKHSFFCGIQPVLPFSQTYCILPLKILTYPEFRRFHKLVLPIVIIIFVVKVFVFILVILAATRRLSGTR